MPASPVLPGARVRTTDDLVGTVERLDGWEEGGSQGALVIRSRQGEQRYRVPRRLVGSVEDESEQSVSYTVVRLLLGSDDLEAFRLDEAAPTEPDSSVVARIPLWGEQLQAQTRPVQRGTVRLHVGVESHEQTLMVPLTEDEVSVEHLTPEHYEARVAAEPEAIYIPVFEEQLVVQTRTVIVEYLQVRRRRVTKEQQVRGLVRREVVTFTQVSDALDDPAEP